MPPSKFTDTWFYCDIMHWYRHVYNISRWTVALIRIAYLLPLEFRRSNSPSVHANVWFSSLKFPGSSPEQIDMVSRLVGSYNRAT